MPINMNFVLIAGAAYALNSVLNNRIGGSDFSGSSEGSLGDGTSVLKLAVSLDADWGSDRNIMQQLSQLAARYNAMTERSDLAKLLSETSLALLRNKNDWNAASLKGDQFRGSSFQRAESASQQLAIQERSKFEEELSAGAVATIKPSTGPISSLPTQAVVSIVVAVRGRSEAAKMTVRNARDVARCLELLAADALTDDGENIMALEVLWSPSSPASTISERNLVIDYLS